MDFQNLRHFQRSTPNAHFLDKAQPETARFKLFPVQLVDKVSAARMLLFPQLNLAEIKQHNSYWVH